LFLFELAGICFQNGGNLIFISISLLDNEILCQGGGAEKAYILFLVIISYWQLLERGSPWNK
jgi:hypothetical protein